MSLNGNLINCINSSRVRKKTDAGQLINYLIFDFLKTFLGSFIRIIITHAVSPIITAVNPRIESLKIFSKF